jgi:hypothetical protein
MASQVDRRRADGVYEITQAMPSDRTEAADRSKAGHESQESAVRVSSCAN